MPAPAPAPSQPTSEELSLVLRLSGTGLMPWSKTKGDQVLAVLVSTLRAAGLAVNGSDMVLIDAKGPTASASGRRRLRDTASGTNSVAAIPSLYSLTQTVELQAVVAAPLGSQSAVQDALVAASTGGQLALALRNQGLSVSKVETLAVYSGTADPPSNLAAITATSAAASPATGSAVTTTPGSSKAAPSMALIIGIGAGVGGAVVFTVGLFVYLRHRKGAGSSDAAGEYRYDKRAAKQSPEPAPRRTASGASIDLEGAYTPRFRQPATPRRSALKGARDGAAAGAAAFHLHAVAAMLPGPRAPEPQLVPGVHLMPRVPSGPAGSGSGAPSIPRTSSATSIGPRVPPNVARTMSAVQDMQDARRAAYLAQQAAEQAAMRDYLRSLPPQVVWEDEAAREKARAQSRLARQPGASRHHHHHGHPSHRSGSHSSRGPSSYTAGASGPGSYATGPSAPASEAEYAISDASAAPTEIEPAGSAQLQPPSLASQRSLEARVAGVSGSGGGPLPEALKRAAAKVQPGSPRRSAARAKGPFATKDSEGGGGLSRLARGSSAPAEAIPEGAVAVHTNDRQQMTGAWVATGGQLSSRQMGSPGGTEVEEQAGAGAEQRQ
ncbi:hypothetical protein ABPG75_009306 [Micractinium tetrahymenae]